MTDGKAPPAYSLTARALHWIRAVLVRALLPLGPVIANNWGGSLQDFLYDMHRSVGTTIIVLVFVRLGYRLTHPPLPLPDDIPPIQRFAAHATHWALYGLLILHPFIGWMPTSASRAPTGIFVFFDLPPILP